MTPIISTTILRTQSDERLVALAKDGHERAFEALVERFHLKPSFAVDSARKYSDAEVAEVRSAATRALSEQRK